MYRDCTLKARFSDGCREIEPVFKNAEASDNTLRLIFSDRSYPLEIILNYSVSDEDDIVTKYITVRNVGDGDRYNIRQAFQCGIFLTDREAIHLFEYQRSMGRRMLAHPNRSRRRRACL